MSDDREELAGALRGMLDALAAHSVTLGAVIDHMAQHECFCPDADRLYAADGESVAQLGVAASALAAVAQQQER